jgi:DNA modification methylase
VGYEINTDYCQLAAARLAEENHKQLGLGFNDV